jgi:hypothetical protein
VSSKAAKPKKASKKKKAEEAAGAPHMKLDSFRSLNETFEVPNIRNLKYTFSYPIPGKRPKIYIVVECEFCFTNER